VRHTAFKRGTAYLERYCMLIVFAAYLERNRQSGHALSFRQWVASRPDIMSARPRARRARLLFPPGSACACRGGPRRRRLCVRAGRGACRPARAPAAHRSALHVFAACRRTAGPLLRVLLSGCRRCRCLS